MELDIPAIDNSHINQKRNHRNMSHIAKVTSSTPNLSARINAVMDEAQNAPAFRLHSPGGDHGRAVSIPVSALRSTMACLSSENLVGLFDADGRLRRTPSAAPSEDTIGLGAAVIANSRVARAGVGIIIVPDQSVPHAIGRTGPVAMETVPAFVRNVEPGVWETVDVNALAEVSLSDSPITSVEIDWETSIAKAIRFKVSRKDRMRYRDQDKLCDEIGAAITLGLARAADACLLSALTAEALSPFTLAHAAAEGLDFGDLRALVGTGAAGAAVGQDGVLRAAGVPANLTGDMAGTIVGAWDRAAVAIRDDINISFERTGLAGEMAVTAWAAMQPIIPVANKFWTIA